MKSIYKYISEAIINKDLTTQDVDTSLLSSEDYLTIMNNEPAVINGVTYGVASYNITRDYGNLASVHEGIWKTVLNAIIKTIDDLKLPDISTVLLYLPFGVSTNIGFSFIKNDYKTVDINTNEILIFDCCLLDVTTDLNNKIRWRSDEFYSWPEYDNLTKKIFEIFKKYLQ